MCLRPVLPDLSSSFFSPFFFLLLLPFFFHRFRGIHVRYEGEAHRCGGAKIGASHEKLLRRIHGIHRILKFFFLLLLLPFSSLSLSLLLSLLVSSHSSAASPPATSGFFYERFATVYLLFSILVPPSMGKFDDRNG